MQHYNAQPMHSPCFIHSHLDKAAALAEWMRIRQIQTNGHDASVQYSESLVVDEDDFGSSLTRQLAETAVGVREMSKQLG